MKINLSGKIAIFVGILIVVISIVLGGLAIIESTNAFIDMAQNEIEEIANTGVMLVESEINKNLAVLSELAKRETITSMEWEIQKKVLSEEIETLGYLDLGIVIPDGTTRYAFDPETTNLADRPHVKKAFEGTANLSNVLVSRTTNETIITDAAPIIVEGKVVGVLLGRRSGDFLSNITDSLGIGERGYAFIIGGDSTLYAHPNRDLVLSQTNVFDEIENDGPTKEFGIALKELGIGNTGFANYYYDGDYRLTALNPIPGTNNWSLAIGNYESDVLRPVSRLRTKIVIISAIIMVLGIILAIGLGKYIAKPIKTTLKMINEMSLGHFDMRSNIKSKDEIGQMSRAMDTFAHNLRTYIVGAMQNIAQGNIDVETPIMDDKDEIGPALAGTVNAIREMTQDATMLVEAAQSGELSTRADASKHQGAYREIVEGVNNTLDAIIQPIEEASVVLEQMAQGDLSYRVNGEYKGDNAKIKNALNSTIDSLDRYITEISETLTQMSNSNMDVSIKADYKGDFGPIKNSLNLIIDTFNEILLDMNNAADQVSSGASQVSDGSQSLSQGATEQASSIEELTSSIGEIASKTKENAIFANQADESSSSAREKAILGNEQMSNLQKAMEEINESSTNISKIIKVIDDIAFQTNILALNAAVEAARAGQHGKGFAVVAEEVRNLAQKSANAASETTGLIESSITKVQEGTEIADLTAKSLDEIVKEVENTAKLVNKIADASNEQAGNLTQINQGVDQVSSVVQGTSATAEQAAAASEELSGQAQLLKDMIAKFKLKSIELLNSNENNLGE